MTNREKFKDEILDIVCSGQNFTKKNNKITSCELLNNCKECDFYSADCNCYDLIKKWCYEEAD